ARSRGLFRFRPTLSENVLGPGTEPVARGRPVSAAVSAAISPAAHAEFFPRVAGRRAGHRRSADPARPARCRGSTLRIIARGSALSGSRSILLYALWYAALGVAAGRVQDRADARRLRLAAYAVAVAALSAFFAVPWLDDVLRLGPTGEGTLDRLLISPGEHAE